MGTYLNCGNEAFSRIASSGYVDKTSLIALINRTIGTTDNLICISRPRRFGKSFSAQMLSAYYDKSCDSHELFKGYKISKDETYEEHINEYHVINLDISGFISSARKKEIPFRKIPGIIDGVLLDEVRMMYSGLSAYDDLNACLLKLVRDTGKKIVFVIDEWDSLIREAKDDPDTQEIYLNLLRGWFKNNNFTPEVVAAAYMTGILPIKKDGSQSAISDFNEYSMLEPMGFAGYIGFTEQEVRDLCEEKHKSFESMKKWYDGYTVGDNRSVYNPYSVMKAIESGKFRSYWKKTSAAETLMTYIDMDQDGLQDDIARLIAGERIVVDTDSFRNDVETFTGKDDVLTLLIHLGYLSYEEVKDSYGDGEDEEYAGLVRIPNEEVRSEFEKILRKARHKSLIALVKKSDQLLCDTLACNSDAVAKAVQDVHESEYAPTYYNNEQGLRYVVKMAYISCVDQYGKLEELPTGHGIADVVFVPRIRSALPAMIVELKWNKSPEGAIRQAKGRNYPKALEQFCGEVLLVGINYDEVSKKHTCEIERHMKE